MLRCQSIARKVHGYPLTLLELHTLVHAICAFAMYALWFRKPLDIKEPTVIEPTQVVIDRLKDMTTEINIQQYPLHTRAKNIGAMKTAHDHHFWLLTLSTLGFLCAGCGAVHLTAWNYHFPTEAEHNLWKGISAQCYSCTDWIIC